MIAILDIYIYIVTSFLSLFYVVFESKLLNYANPCRNWTFQRFARVAEKKERNGTNEKSDTRYDMRKETLYIYIYTVAKTVEFRICSLLDLEIKLI